MLPLPRSLSCTHPINVFDNLPPHLKLHAKANVTSLIATTNMTIDVIARRVMPANSERALNKFLGEYDWDDQEFRLDRLEEREQDLKDEQAEKIQGRKKEEQESGEKKRGRKPKHPDLVELPDDTKANVTVPESRTKKTHDGCAQGYNGKAMVDTDSQVIVAQSVTDEANGKQQLEPMLEACEETNGERPDQLLADAEYWSEANADLADEEMELFVATQKDRKRRKELREQGPPRGRILDDYGPKELMERKLRTKRGRAIYKERSTSVEPVFSQLVLRGLDRFLLDGMDGAAAEWSLISATHNLLKLFRSGWTPERAVGAAATTG